MRPTPPTPRLPGITQPRLDEGYLWLAMCHPLHLRIVWLWADRLRVMFLYQLLLLQGWVRTLLPPP